MGTSNQVPKGKTHIISNWCTLRNFEPEDISPPDRLRASLSRWAPTHRLMAGAGARPADSRPGRSAGLRRSASTPRHVDGLPSAGVIRSEEHTSELPSLMRISYAVLCLKK